MKPKDFNDATIHNLRLILRKFTNCLYNDDYLDRRYYEYAYPRQVFALVLSELQVPLITIAKILSKHHSTIYNSIGIGWDLTTQYTAKKKWLPVYNQFYEEIKKELDEAKQINKAVS